MPGSRASAASTPRARSPAAWSPVASSTPRSTISTPTPRAPLYSAVRAAANHLVRNVAGEVARKNVQVNALGTNFMDFPEFLRATGGTDPKVREALEAAVPMKRLGTVDECAAMCAIFLDGTSRFTTGQFVAYAGGWI